ncbi:hypothetical protein CRUP_003526 [Coryphaenoides rupestris]|nr:hypothetical protein CRUP_003526 [Coryphaenoides rupestris]
MLCDSLVQNAGVESDRLRTLVGQMGGACAELQASACERRRNPSYRGLHAQTPSNRFLGAVVELIATAKTLLGWLDRAPVTGMRDLRATKNNIIHLCLELTSTVQKDCTVYQMEDKILEVARALKAVCEETLGPPAAPPRAQGPCLEQVCISNVTPGEGLSPADQTRRIHAGDEVIQVNGQTVVGWQLKHLVNSLKAKPGDVVLVLKKRPSGVSCTFSAAPLKNLRWRPPLVQVSGLNKPKPSEKGLEDLVKTGNPAVLDLYIPPPPSVPYTPRGGTADVVMRPKSPNSSLDVGGGRSLTLVDQQTSLGPSPDALVLPAPVRMRHRWSTRGVSDPLGRPGLHGRTAKDVMHRCLSNERIATILEDDAPRFPLPQPLPQRGLRGVDHIRGSRCFVSAELHNSATIPYQDPPGRKPAVAAVTAPPASVSASKRSSSSASGHTLLGGWLARLRLLSH